jgi:peptidylprolyl isomerase
MARGRFGFLAGALVAVALTAAACSSGGKSSSSVSASGGAAASATTPPATTPPAGGATGSAGTVPAAIATKPTVTVPSGPPPTTLVVKDLVVGTGAPAVAGETVQVQYVGVSYATGQQFDASWDDGPGGTPRPFSFQLGAGQVIKGWDEGVAGMRVGGRRELIIPPVSGTGTRARVRSRPTKPWCSWSICSTSRQAPAGSLPGRRGSAQAARRRGPGWPGVGPKPPP